MSGRDVDLVIIGGGAHGISVAYEASRRDRSFVLVERDDFAEGASSSSLKILHGGLRYLQSLDLTRSLESVRARRRLLRLAPHLTRPLRCRLELGDRGAAYRLLFRAGLLVNDAVTLTRNRGVDPARHIPRSRYPYWTDAIVEDTERLLFSLLGASLDLARGRSEAWNHATLTNLEPDGEGVRALVGMRGGGGEEVNARLCVRCTGGHGAGSPAAVAMNLVTDSLELTRRGEAVAMWHPADGRNVFVVPWRDRSIVGTWDRRYPGDPSERFRFDGTWVDEMLEWLAPVHPELTALTRTRVRFVHAGLLPLDRAGGGLLGRATINGPQAGVLDVVGVKYTTALSLASAVMDRVDRVIGRPPRARSPEPALPPHAGVIERFSAGVPARREVLGPPEIGITGGAPAVTRGAVEHAIASERAATLSDLMLRRLGVATAGHPGAELTGAIAAEAARLLEWPEERRRAEIESFDRDWRFAENVPAAETKG